MKQVLGYLRWENFVVVTDRSLESCKTLGISVDDHFREVTKMIAIRWFINGADETAFEYKKRCFAVHAHSEFCINRLL